MAKRLHIAVLSGGPSSEHEVSLKSGARVADALRKRSYEVTDVPVDKKGEWSIAPERVRAFADCAFIALHGTYGEDGTVQGILEAHRIPYTGSDALSSALGMNKFLSLRLFRTGGLRVPDTLIVSANEWRKDGRRIVRDIVGRFPFPLVVKPNRDGSSVGVSIVRSARALPDALAAVFAFSREALAEEFVQGREITCGVLDRGIEGSAFPLLPTEIIPVKGEFFDYRAKYEVGGSLEVTPPEGIGPAALARLRKTALAAHALIRARGFSRTDMILSPSGEIYVLEINTVPGLTDESLLPKAALANGIEFPDLAEMIVSAALAGRRGI